MREVNKIGGKISREIMINASDTDRILTFYVTSFIHMRNVHPCCHIIPGFSIYVLS